jgi:spore germination cell wall hydrolase CwlJ-like protein
MIPKLGCSIEQNGLTEEIKMHNSQISTINLARVCNALLLVFVCIVSFVFCTGRATANESPYLMIENDHLIRRLLIIPEDHETKRFLTLVKTEEKVKFNNNDLYCLAKNIYHEAGGEPTKGKYAVAQVTINRMNDSRFYGHTICKIVMASSQFSWTNSQELREARPKGAAWDECMKIARATLEEGFRLHGMDSALYFHAYYVQPRWKFHLDRLVQIGGHIFYTFKT